MRNAPNAAERVAALLREDLLSGHYQLGERLKQEELAARFQAGRYTVRSAIGTLASSGMLDHRANRGAVVPWLTRERVNELSDHREVLETGALRRGAALATVADATHALERLTSDASWVDVVLTHQRIHHELVVTAGNDKLVQAYAQCEDELLYVVSAVRRDYTAPRLADLHTQLLLGLQRGPEEAVRALERDLRTGRAAVHEAVDRAEEPFLPAAASG